MQPIIIPSLSRPFTRPSNRVTACADCHLTVTGWHCPTVDAPYQPTTTHLTHADVLTLQCTCTPDTHCNRCVYLFRESIKHHATNAEVQVYLDSRPLVISEVKKPFMRVSQRMTVCGDCHLTVEGWFCPSVDGGYEGKEGGLREEDVWALVCTCGHVACLRCVYLYREGIGHHASNDEVEAFEREVGGGGVQGLQCRDDDGAGLWDGDDGVEMGEEYTDGGVSEDGVL